MRRAAAHGGIPIPAAVVPLTPTIVATLEEYIVTISKHRLLTSTLWYRGQLSKHNLTPSLYRNKKIYTFSQAKEMEDQLRTDFISLGAIYYGNAIEYDLGGLMQMQHYRIPTRLMDWSRNPLIALFFALAEAQEQKKTEDTAVWLLDPNRWNQVALRNVTGPSRPLDKTDVEMQGYISFDRHIIPPSENPVTVKGIANSPRIAAQQGAFVLFGNAPKPLEAMEDAAIRLGIDNDILTKLILPAKSASAVFEELLGIGITDDFVYPDLQGVVNHIRRRAGYSR